MKLLHHQSDILSILRYFQLPNFLANYEFFLIIFFLTEVDRSLKDHWPRLQSEKSFLQGALHHTRVLVCRVLAAGKKRSTSPVEVGAAPHCVVAEIFLGFLVAKVLQRVGPQQVTHGSESRRLLKPIQLQRENAQNKRWQSRIRFSV